MTRTDDRILVDDPPHERLTADAGIECGKFYSYSYKSRAVCEVNSGIDSERYDGMKDGESKDLQCKNV